MFVVRVVNVKVSNFDVFFERDFSILRRQRCFREATIADTSRSCFGLNFVYIFYQHSNNEEEVFQIVFYPSRSYYDVHACIYAILSLTGNCRSSISVRFLPEASNFFHL